MVKTIGISKYSESNSYKKNGEPEAFLCYLYLTAVEMPNMHR
jgi:hypothetical protein